MSPGAFSALLARAALAGVLARVCRGLYVAPTVLPNDGRALFRFAAQKIKAHYARVNTALLPTVEAALQAQEADL